LTVGFRAETENISSQTQQIAVPGRPES
jgi:hypothetical protein